MISNRKTAKSLISSDIRNIKYRPTDKGRYFCAVANKRGAADAERYARAIFDISQNFKHADFRLNTTWRHVSYDDKLKALVPKGAVGINPKVILATLFWESQYGKPRDDGSIPALFGSRSSRVRQLSFEEQLDIAVNQYIQYYYWGLYAQGNMPELYDIKIVDGDIGGSYTPANAAMYARGQYCTEDLDVLEKWQTTFVEGKFL